MNMNIVLGHTLDNNLDIIAIVPVERRIRKKIVSEGEIVSLDDRDTMSMRTTICGMKGKVERDQPLRKNHIGLRIERIKMEIVIRVGPNIDLLGRIVTETRARMKKITIWTTMTQSRSQTDMSLRMTAEVVAENVTETENENVTGIGTGIGIGIGIEIEIETEIEAVIVKQADQAVTTRNSAKA